MAEVSRRDRKAEKLHQLYTTIDLNVNLAPPKRITILQRKLNRI